MMSVSDFFYGIREPLWIVRTPNSGQKSGSNNPQTPQYNPQTPQNNPQTPQYNQYNQTPGYNQTPQYNQQALQYSPLQAIPYNVQTPQSVNRDMGGDGIQYNSVVELKVPVCCEACEERVKHALLNVSGVESVKTDTYTQRVAVKGNVAPADILRICRKLHKRSELLQKKGPQNVNMMDSPKW
ncbi:unnamed protein product [Calypogeia fissa]